MNFPKMHDSKNSVMCMNAIKFASMLTNDGMISFIAFEIY